MARGMGALPCRTKPFSTGSNGGVGQTSRSCLHDHFKAAVDQPLSVKGHRVLVRLQPRVGHDLLHAVISYLARRPDDPGENDRLVVLALDRHGKRGELPIWYVVAPTLDEFQCAVLLENRGS